MKSARCFKCNTIYQWSGRPLVRDSYCPVCKLTLSRTSKLASDRVERKAISGREVDAATQAARENGK